MPVLIDHLHRHQLWRHCSGGGNYMVVQECLTLVVVYDVFRSDGCLAGAGMDV